MYFAFSTFLLIFSWSASTLNKKPFVASLLLTPSHKQGKSSASKLYPEGYHLCVQPFILLPLISPLLSHPLLPAQKMLAFCSKGSEEVEGKPCSRDLLLSFHSTKRTTGGITSLISYFMWVISKAANHAKRSQGPFVPASLCIYEEYGLKGDFLQTELSGEPGWQIILPKQQTLNQGHLCHMYMYIYIVCVCPGWALSSQQNTANMQHEMWFLGKSLMSYCSSHTGRLALLSKSPHGLVSPLFLLKLAANIICGAFFHRKMFISKFVQRRVMELEWGRDEIYRHLCHQG